MLEYTGMSKCVVYMHRKSYERSAVRYKSVTLFVVCIYIQNAGCPKIEPMQSVCLYLNPLHGFRISQPRFRSADLCSCAAVYNVMLRNGFLAITSRNNEIFSITIFC